MSKSKYAKKVYACPGCWRVLSVGNKPEFPVQCCQIYHNVDRLIVFDSQVEYDKGIELKTMERTYKIGELKHHEKFELWPNERIGMADYEGHTVEQLFWQGKFFNYGHDETSPYLTIEIPHQFNSYISDFSYIQSGIKHVIEVKGTEKKKAKIRYVDPVTEEKFSMPVKIPWPFFTRQDPLSHFRLKCQLMKVIHGIDVEIWAGQRLFKFDEKWKLKEVIK